VGLLGGEGLVLGGRDIGSNSLGNIDGLGLSDVLGGGVWNLCDDCAGDGGVPGFNNLHVGADLNDM